MSLYQDITHDSGVPVSTRAAICYIFGTKPNERITGVAVVFVVTKDTDSCLETSTVCIEALSVTVGLQVIN